MELTETINSLNNQLMDLFGIDTITGEAIWRIVWSDRQYEKRRVEATPAGIILLHPQVMMVPKYPYIKARYILERLVLIPEQNQDELPASRLSYEPMWTFQTDYGEYLPPNLQAAQFVVDTIYAAMGKVSMAKYKESEMESSEEGRQQRIKELQDELFGDESGLEGKTFLTGEAIVVPSNYKKGN